VPMQHEDERAQVLREVLKTVARTREALHGQRSELTRYSEQMAGENKRLEERAQAQALCLEQQQGTAERLRAELQQLGGEARELREAEREARAALERQAAADDDAELRGGELLGRLHRAEAGCEVLAASLRHEADSAQFEQHARDLLQEKSKCQDLESTCQGLGEELAASRGVERQRHGHLESAYRRLEEELSECQRTEASELRRLEDLHAEHQHSSGLESRRWQQSCGRLEEELLQRRDEERSEHLELEVMHRQLEEGESRRMAERQQELLDELAESRRAESLEFRRLQGLCRHLEEQLCGDAEEAYNSEESPHAGESPRGEKRRRASGVLAVLASCYAAAAAAAVGSPRGHPGRASGTAEALRWAYAAAASVCSAPKDRALGTATDPPDDAAALGAVGGGFPTPVVEAGRWYAMELAEQRMRAEAEVAESRRTVAQLRAELSVREAALVVVPEQFPEHRLQELEARCEASAVEAGVLQARCRELEGNLAACQAENAWLRAEVERHEAAASAAPPLSVPPDEEPELCQLRSELAEAQALGRRLLEAEGAHAEGHQRADEAAECAGQRARSAEARALALGEEMKELHAQALLRLDHKSGDLLRPVAAAPRGGEQPRSPSLQRSPGGLAMERRRLAGLAHGSAAAVAKLLREVRGLNDARAVLASGGSDARVVSSRLHAAREPERHARQLERTNQAWGSAVARRSPGPDDDSACLVPSGGSPGGGSGRGTDSAGRECMSPQARGAALAAALQHTACRLESLHGQLRDLHPREQAFSGG